MNHFAYHRLVVGYHGCDRSVAEDVLLNGGALRRSANPWDWLGAGVYFWEHGPERAREFAEWKYQRGEIEAPVVVGAYLHLGRCFDLTDRVAVEQLRIYYDAFAVQMNADGKQLPHNAQGRPEDFDLVKRYLDCAVINFTMSREESIGAGYDTVRGVFVEGPEAYPGARVFSKTHVQIAVRNPSCVLGYFKPAGY
jgi:hypothetical protein